MERRPESAAPARDHTREDFRVAPIPNALHVLALMIVVLRRRQRRTDPPVSRW